MELLGVVDGQRVYRRNDGSYVTVERRVRGYYEVVELSVLHSLDPADRRRVEEVRARLRAQLAVFFAEHEELDIAGDLITTVGPEKITMVAADGVVVPAAAVCVEQAHWPAAPEEP